MDAAMHDAALDGALVQLRGAGLREATGEDIGEVRGNADVRAGRAVRSMFGQ